MNCLLKNCKKSTIGSYDLSVNKLNSSFLWIVIATSRASLSIDVFERRIYESDRSDLLVYVEKDLLNILNSGPNKI